MAIFLRFVAVAKVAELNMSLNEAPSFLELNQIKLEIAEIFNVRVEQVAITVMFRGDRRRTLQQRMSAILRIEIRKLGHASAQGMELRLVAVVLSVLGSFTLLGLAMAACYMRKNKRVLQKLKTDGEQKQTEEPQKHLEPSSAATNMEQSVSQPGAITQVAARHAQAPTMIRLRSPRVRSGSSIDHGFLPVDRSGRPVDSSGRQDRRKTHVLSRSGLVMIP
eukprot:g80300.t1